MQKFGIILLSLFALFLGGGAFFVFAVAAETCLSGPNTEGCIILQTFSLLALIPLAVSVGVGWLALKMNNGTIEKDTFVFLFLLVLLIWLGLVLFTF
ncbi:hypothetical protein PH7735_01563 [Shimia thalassica]|uniref:Uncharacterized protein n=1 Tax=Shimia thalassica TaxID=1715693 RepID=A0A0N7M904_9RHOB|nr:hypothetical protein [Shimia thalassica]CUJ93137.1 hypothetical protein PH7735_01563 [Shimia thalassica]